MMNQDNEKDPEESYEWENAPTIRTQSGPLKNFAELAQTEVVKPAEGQSAGMARAALTVLTPTGPMSLLVYGGAELTLGRRAGKTEQHACTRLLPLEEMDPENRYLSSDHIGLSVSGGTVTLRDLDSASGTWVDGFRLAKGSQRELGPEARLNLAKALDLQIFLLPRASLQELALGDEENTVSGEPSVFIERVNNGQQYAYALIPGRLVLALDGNGRLRGTTGTAGCEAELFFKDGGLWLRDGGLEEGQCVPLSPGLEFSIGTVPINVREVPAIPS